MNCTTVQHIKLVAYPALTTDVFQSAYDVFTSVLLAFLTRPSQMLHVYQLSHLPSESGTVQVYKSNQLMLKYADKDENSLS